MQLFSSEPRGRLAHVVRCFNTAELINFARFLMLVTWIETMADGCTEGVLTALDD